jgi:hypothetical protein
MKARKLSEWEITWYIGVTNLGEIQSFIQVGIGKQLAN